MKFSTVEDLQYYLNFVYATKLQSQKKLINLFDSTLEKDLIPANLLFKNLRNIFFDKTNNFGYCDPQGFIRFRQFISKRYFGNKNKYSNIVITSGGQESLYLCLKYIIDQNPRKKLTIGVENFSYLGFRHIVQELKHQSIRIPLNSDGVDIEELKNILKNQKLDVLYIIPDIQNPTGITYSNKNRKQLIFLQKKYGFYIICDSCYRDLYYKKNSLRKISYFMNDKSFIVGSFSKTISPALRTGWIYSSKEINKLAMIKRSINLFQSPIFQLSVLSLMENGYDDQIRSLNKIMFLKKEFLIQILKIFRMDQYFFWNNPAGGFYLWLTPKNKKIIIPLEKIILQRIIIASGSFFSGEDKDKNYIRICYSNENCLQLYKAIKMISFSFNPENIKNIPMSACIKLIKLFIKIKYLIFVKNVFSF